MGGSPMVFGPETRTGRPCHDKFSSALRAIMFETEDTVRGADPTKNRSDESRKII
jgi:hypothetical protein